jgi:soluble lytic murein transglycosylase
MRGIGHTLSRLPLVPALAGTVILAGLAAPAIAAGGPAGSRDGILPADEVALAVPRLPRDALRRGEEVALPQPLDQVQAALLRRAFAQVDRGEITEAQRLAHEAGTQLLTGHLMADWLLGPHHRSNAEELRDWLDHYNDLPEAERIRALLIRRSPGAAPQPPARVNDVAVPALPPLPEPPDEMTPVSTALDAAVLVRAQRGDVPGLLHMIAARRLKPAAAAHLYALASRALFAGNENAAALRVAQHAPHPADGEAAHARYVAGLAAWRLDRARQARDLFAEAADTRDAPAKVQAAAAYWAARAAARLHDPGAVLKWMRRAAASGGTLHGLIARRILGMDTGIPPGGGLLSGADVDAIAATPEGLRAFALLQVGQSGHAQAELHSLWRRLDDPAMRRALLMVTGAAGLRSLALQLAAEARPADGSSPVKVPRLRPAGGFQLDPALVYALARMESNFDPGAVSPAGARGLMQIMPVTARYVTGNHSMPADRLDDPAFNLALGQRYVAWLSDQDGVAGDLIQLLMSYNAGPANAARWRDGLRGAGETGDDPMLFIEAIPNRETRRFVYNVLNYTWLYAARLHVPAPSLDEMAAGEFPRFTPRAGGSKLTAIGLRGN